MTIEQLIATHHNRGKGPSPLQQLSQMETLKRQRLGNQAIQAEGQRTQNTEALKFAANIGRQIRNEQDPMRKAQIYNSGLSFARSRGYNLDDVPQEYNDRAQYFLDVAEAQVNEPESVIEVDQLASQLPEDQRQSFMALASADPKKAVDFAAGILKPQQEKSPTGKMQEFELAQSQGYTGSFLDYQKELSNKSGITISPDGTVQIGGTPKPLDKTNAREAEKKIISAGASLARLERIKENYDPHFLTYRGKLDRLTSSVKNKAGITLSKEEKEALRQRRKFTQGVNQEFNAYRKLITGAAASIQELESLKKAMISDDLGPEEFEGAFEEYRNELSRTIRINNKLLREGLEPGTKQFGESLDALFLTDQDDDIESRGSELEQQGLTDEQIFQKLLEEGYVK